MTTPTTMSLCLKLVTSYMGTVLLENIAALGELPLSLGRTV